MSIEKTLIKTESEQSPFEQEIRKMATPICHIFKKNGVINPVNFKADTIEMGTKDSEEVKKKFPKTSAESGNKVLRASGPNPSPLRNKRIAVLFSGGPAAGGHNVVCGIYDAIGKENTLIGVKAGPKGLIEGDFFEISAMDISSIRNTGGFDFLGSDRTKIKTEEQFSAVRHNCKKNNIDAVIVIGGDDSNTNAAVLAEYLFDEGIQVIGCPKTIDGDLQAGDLLPISFGFDSATKIYSELVGNILKDTPSSRKYWHFIKLMGRSASHVALETALQTKPAICLISEEVAEKNMSLSDIIEYIAGVIIKRANEGIYYGTVLIPEGLIEFIPEMHELLDELNEKVAQYKTTLSKINGEEKREFMYRKLTAKHAQLMASLPEYIEDMLLADRDAHGNLQVSLIPTERLIIDMIKNYIREETDGIPFKTHNHFFGYEGRCGTPSLFDAAYCYNIGLCAGSLVLTGKTGYMASFTSLDKGGEVVAIPLTGLINIERRHGQDEFVIEKALVKLDSPAFKFFESRRQFWADKDYFSSPGPRQLWGPTANQIPLTVALNQGYEDIFTHL